MDLMDCQIGPNSILSCSQPVTLNQTRSKYIFEVRDKNEFLCGLNWDGTLDTGPNFKPDAAAKLFWDAVHAVALVGTQPKATS